MKVADTQMEFMKACTAALKSQNNVDVGEYEAIGIAVIKKTRMNGPVQMVDAETIINTVVLRGILNILTDDPNLCDNNCFSHLAPIQPINNVKLVPISNHYQYLTHSLFCSIWSHLHVKQYYIIQKKIHHVVHLQFQNPIQQMIHL